MKIIDDFGSKSLQRKSGFTLIEMLTVIVIMGVLITLSTPAITGTMQANRLTMAGQNLLGRLAQAQQLSASMNNPIEVRFYKYSDPERSMLHEQFFAYHFLTVKTHTGVAGDVSEVLTEMSAPYDVGAGSVICSATISGYPASKMFDNAVLLKDGDGNSPDSPQFFKKVVAAQYAAIRFFPDGAVRRVSVAGQSGSPSVTEYLTLPDAYITVVPDKYTDGGSVPNYITVQIDPYNGHVRMYQPSP